MSYSAIFCAFLDIFLLLETKFGGYLSGCLRLMCVLILLLCFDE